MLQRIFFFWLLKNDKQLRHVTLIRARGKIGDILFEQPLNRSLVSGFRRRTQPYFELFPNLRLNAMRLWEKRRRPLVAKSRSRQNEPKSKCWNLANADESRRFFFFFYHYLLFAVSPIFVTKVSNVMLLFYRLNVVSRKINWIFFRSVIKNFILKLWA